MSRIQLLTKDYELAGYYKDHIYEILEDNPDNKFSIKIIGGTCHLPCWVLREHISEPYPIINTSDEEILEDIVKPKRYNRGTMEVWDAWVGLDLGPFESNILKYISRYKDKGGVKDLQKAKVYLDKLIEIESNK